MKSKKTIIICALVTSLILGGVISAVSLLFNHPLRIEKPTFIYIDRDDTADSVYVKLQRDLNATHLTGFKILARLKKYDQQIHSGAYRFDASINTLTLFRRLSSGHQTPVKVVIPSVRTLSRLARSLDRQLMPDSTEFARLVGDSAFCASLGFSLETMPALFIPNTYEAYWNTDAETFIQRMKKEYERFWTQERKDKAQACGLTPVEVSTLASIVEEETANKSEMPMVAELYLNRLQAGMPLQADPTIKFSLQEFGLRRILHKHLEVESPYNTYKHAGLPPGPIRIASIQGIESVLNHAQHDYLYMCAKEDFSGTHNFAATFAEHQANARRYQSTRRETCSCGATKLRSRRKMPTGAPSCWALIPACRISTGRNIWWTTPAIS